MMLNTNLIKFEYQDDDRTLKIFTNYESDSNVSKDEIMAEFALKKDKLTRFEVIDNIKGRYFVKRGFDSIELEIEDMIFNVYLK